MATWGLDWWICRSRSDTIEGWSVLPLSLLLLLLLLLLLRLLLPLLPLVLLTIAATRDPVFFVFDTTGVRNR